MIHLFDTNAWLRLAERPEMISPAARRQLDEVRGAFPLSVVSIWEVGLKARKGKLELTLPLDEWLAEMCRPSFVKLLPIDAEIARLFGIAAAKLAQTDEKLRDRALKPVRDFVKKLLGRIVFLHFL